MVDVLNKSETLPSQQYFDKITNLFGSMSPGSPERETFCQDALKWSIKGTDFKTGHPDLHKRIAQVFWRGNVLLFFFWQFLLLLIHCFTHFREKLCYG